MFRLKAQLNVKVIEVDLLTIIRVTKVGNANLAPMQVLIECVQKETDFVQQSSEKKKKVSEIISNLTRGGTLLTLGQIVIPLNKYLNKEG